MKQRTWCLAGLLILCVSVMESSCWEGTTTKRDVDPDTTVVFMMEYDHVWSYDVLDYSGEQRLGDAFSPSGTELDIYVSNFISDDTWNYDSMSYYIDVYAEKTNGQYDHKCYLLALGEVTNIPDPPGKITVGLTSNPGEEGEVTSINFVYRIRQLYPDYEKMVHQVTIHELGHARAYLTHLCLDDSTMSPDHDNEGCVMAEGRYAACTGQDVTEHLRFCNKCINNLAKAKW